jgi:hypothetical protein
MSALRARCPDCRANTAVSLGGDYQCHACGREFGAGLVRVTRAWGDGGDAMESAALMELPWPEAAGIDAHGDLNTPGTSPSGNAWGMPLRMLIDARDVDPRDVALIGARNLDPPEAAFIRARGIRAEVGELPDHVYVALDCDAIEPGEIDVFMPEPGGISLADLEQFLASIRRPAGAGFTGLVGSERNEAILARLGHALGL